MSNREGIKGFLQKQWAELQLYGVAGVSTKIMNRFLLPYIKLKISNASLSRKPLVLIVNGAEKTVSEVHRVIHFKNKLHLLKVQSFIITSNQINLLSHGDFEHFNLLYIHRAGMNSSLQNLIKSFQQSKKVILFDIDDLVFDKKYLSFWTSNDEQAERNKSWAMDNAHLLIDAMRSSSAVMAPTLFLQKRVLDIFPGHCFILRNHLDTESLDVGKALFQKAKRKSPHVVLGYFPGTKTHRQDFAVIEPVLKRLLKKYPHVQLKIVGDPSLAKNFQDYKKQLIVKKRVPYHKLMAEHAGIDINLAPLEKNPFTEAKSEIKYIFAGAAGIPTVATDTDAFRFAIQDGVNGFLASSESDWEKKLEQLILHAELRQRLGQNAFTHVHSFYTPEFQAQELKKILQAVHFLPE